MATIIIHAGHFKPGKINIRLGIPANSIFFTPDVMRLTDVATGSVIYYKLEDLAELEVASEESTKKMMGAIGWGLVGDLALGPLGLLAGVLSGGKQTNVKFIGNFKDGRRMLATTDSKTFTAMQAALFNKTLAPISPPEPAPTMNLLQKLDRMATASREREEEAFKAFFAKFNNPIVQVVICLFVGVFIFRLVDVNVINPEKAAAYAAEMQARNAIAQAKEAEEAKLAARRAEHRRRCGLDQPAEYIIEHCQTEEGREAERAVMRNQILRDEYSRRFSQ